MCSFCRAKLLGGPSKSGPPASRTQPTSRPRPRFCWRSPEGADKGMGGMAYLGVGVKTWATVPGAAPTYRFQINVQTWSSKLLVWGGGGGRSTCHVHCLGNAGTSSMGDVSSWGIVWRGEQLKTKHPTSPASYSIARHQPSKLQNPQPISFQTCFVRLACCRY